ncbi:hypothetical protein GLAREA_05088 [Glarea lozoyensis ATCC 20868]|uniref:Uncharacterized protein n=1 Tax=Glarea lozoyensis (strain ATCC 20868 / MF5171) TaxID=1116229 RepID=S3DDF6_GLAL2|nr:uncharacterized protein GLAREA_05088 [Glarea lozoyensis ATCC 20868]EPE35750.1 hypothetical protein GLAREA_05088 [Glarea lozoyensis ATCC 20868]
MKFSFTLLGLLSSQAVASNVFKRACNADNCSRGIAGTNGSPPRTSRIADCSKLLATTITPSASTVTVSITTTLPTLLATSTIIVDKRQAAVIPGVLPAYATYCKSYAAYTSACSCAGVTQTTVYASTPIVTVTATATSTPLPPPPPAVTCPTGQTACSNTCIDLTSSNANCGACGNACATGYVCGQGQCVLPSTYSCTPGGFPACGGSCGGTCFPDVNGAGVCKISVSCAGLTACNTGADCESTYCLVNACGRVCAATSKLCPTNNNPKMLFAKKYVALEERTVVLTEIGPVGV